MGRRSKRTPKTMSVLLAFLAVVLSGAAAPASPYFLIDSEVEWQEAVATGRVQPMSPSEWSDYMMQWDLHLVEGEPYPLNKFAPPELYVWHGGGGGGLDPEDAGLVMAWGTDTPGSWSSAWKYIYMLDPDLTGSTINISVTAPQFNPMNGNQVNNVSFGIQDINGNVRSWNWQCGPGAPIPWNVPTQITINPMVLSVNAATPAASGFASNPMFNITQSALFVVDENAVWVAQQIPRMWNYWHNLYVTPPIPPKLPDPLKWSQPPVESQPGLQPPLFYGWDEKSIHSQPPICADDWECTDSRPVTDVHWWGSFIGWTQPDPPALPKAFHLAIWTDVPKGPNNMFSHPGTLVWEHVCDTYTWNFAGYDKDPRGEMQNEACFQFHQYIPREKWFYQDPGPNGKNVYWLSIAAIYDESIPRFPWGWKTRPHYYNDDAVRIFQVFDPAGGSIWPPHIGVNWAQGQPIEYPPGTSWDLAFELTTIEAEEWDWGDAPDKPYPTLAANNGARHRIVQGLRLGNLIDAEPDGQPDTNALGDDNNNDDEDGVTFASAVIPGRNSTVVVNVASTVPQAFLDAWIDFNGNGLWTDAGEQVAVSVPVANGANSLTFAVPNGIGAGVSRFARFRLSTTGGLGVGGAAPDGEVEDYQVRIGYKWVQKPDLSPTGIDVNATEPFILADDFQCTVTGPITDIHLWGSWYHDLLPMQDPSQVVFRLSIHKDIPAAQSPTGYSMPGEPLWHREFLPGQFMVRPSATEINEGWMDPPERYEFPGDHVCWEYDFQIDGGQFIQRGTPERPEVYWLDVQAKPMMGEALFGWKTSLDHWNDDAVWGQGIEPYPGPWQELRYPPGHNMAGQSVDLAFAITGEALQVPVGELTVTENIDVRDHFWWRTDPDPDNEMASLALSAAIEDILWDSITLQASGTGNDAFDIASVKVWADNDNDGKVTPPDVLIGTGAYPVDNGTVTIALAPAQLVLTGGFTPVVVSYTMSAAAAPGRTYQFDVTGATGTGQSSGMPVGVVISPSPLSSARKIVAPRPISIGEAKKLSIGTQFLLDEKICTADFQTNMGLVYIEEPDRSAGIGIETSTVSPGPVHVWDRVSVLGVCKLMNGTELVVTPQHILVTPGVAPPMGSRFAVGMNNKWTGGGAFGEQPALYDDAWFGVQSTGLNNVGMLVTTWGKVTYHQANFTFMPLIPPGVAADAFWINDGTNLLDGYSPVSGGRTVGIACWVRSPYPGLPNVGEYWGITGILRAIPSPMGVPGTEPVRLLVPRTSADMVRYK